MSRRDVVDHAVKREAALRDGRLDGRMLLEHLDGLLDVEFGDTVRAGVVVGQPV